MADAELLEVRQQLANMAAQMAQLQQQTAAQQQAAAAQAAQVAPPPAIPEDVARNLREMVAEIRSQKATIEALRREAEDSKTAAHDTEVRMRELREVAARSKNVVDSKMLNKPANFDNKEEHWPEFAFKYENWLCGVEASARIYLRWAELHDGEITDLLTAPDAIPDEDVEKLQKQIYLSLAQMLTGESLDILRNGREDEGFDAWRRLWRRWDPKTIGRNRSAYLRIAQPGVAKSIEQASKMLEQWESSIRDYEQKRKKVVDEELKCAVVVEMMPKDLRLHLQLNARTLTDYNTIRQEIVSYLEARKVLPGDGVTPMDLDALMRGLDAKGRYRSRKGKGDGKGKGKDDKGGGKWGWRPQYDARHDQKGGGGAGAGKGKDGGKDPKGKGKLDPKGKPDKGKGKWSQGQWQQQAQPTQFQGYCGYCQKWGHKREDCWQRQRQTAALDLDAPAATDKAEPEQELGGFDLCMVEKDEFAELNSYEYLEATVDSGAAVSVMPVGTCEGYKVVPSKASLQGVHYRAAGGHRIPDLGTRTITAGHEGGGEARLACSVAEVKKMLISVAKIIDKGHRVSFGPRQEDCFIENIKDGKRIPVKRKNDVFVIRLKVRPPSKGQRSGMLATVEEEESGGPRRAARP